MCMCASHAFIYALHTCVRINGMKFCPLERFRNTHPIPKMTWITIVYFLLHSYFFFIVIHTVISSDWVGNERSAWGWPAQPPRKCVNTQTRISYYYLGEYSSAVGAWTHIFVWYFVNERCRPKNILLKRLHERQSRRFVSFVWYISLCRLLFVYSVVHNTMLFTRYYGSFE